MLVGSWVTSGTMQSILQTFWQFLATIYTLKTFSRQYEKWLHKQVMQQWHSLLHNLCLWGEMCPDMSQYYSFAMRFWFYLSHSNLWDPCTWHSQQFDALPSSCIAYIAHFILPGNVLHCLSKQGCSLMQASSGGRQGACSMDLPYPSFPFSAAMTQQHRTGTTAPHSSASPQASTSTPATATAEPPPLLLLPEFDPMDMMSTPDNLLDQHASTVNCDNFWQDFLTESLNEMSGPDQGRAQGNK